MKNFLYLLVTTLIVMGGMECPAQSVSGTVDEHDYVDLGLSSGTKWATCNVGAKKPADYGDYFAWGETKPKEDYSWNTYKWCQGDYNRQTKYCMDSDYGSVDSLEKLSEIDDAATANWGNEWRIPTIKEFKELMDGCDWVWMRDYQRSGNSGRLGTSKFNGNTIFLPAAGFQDGTDLYNADLNGTYWTPALVIELSDSAYYLGFDTSISENKLYYERFYGRTVRAVVK